MTKSDDDMSPAEKEAYIDNALMNLRLFLTAADPERHAMLLTHDNNKGEMSTYSFNADPATALFMLTSALETIQEDVLMEKLNRSIN